MRHLPTLLLLLLSGCATIIEGASQTILVEVVPDTGSCDVTRQGEVLGRSTPGNRSVKISKSYYDLVFSCAAPGHTPKTEALASALSPYTVGSALLLDFGIVDSLSGAWMKYPTKVTVVLPRV